MLRYRICRDVNGRYFALPAWVEAIPVDETYATRAAAEEVAAWLNQLARMSTPPPAAPEPVSRLTSANTR